MASIPRARGASRWGQARSNSRTRQAASGGHPQGGTIRRGCRPFRVAPPPPFLSHAPALSPDSNPQHLRERADTILWIKTHMAKFGLHLADLQQAGGFAERSAGRRVRAGPLPRRPGPCLGRARGSAGLAAACGQRGPVGRAFPGRKLGSPAGGWAWHHMTLHPETLPRASQVPSRHASGRPTTGNHANAAPSCGRAVRKAPTAVSRPSGARGPARRRASVLPGDARRGDCRASPHRGRRVESLCISAVQQVWAGESTAYAPRRIS